MAKYNYSLELIDMVERMDAFDKPYYSESPIDDDRYEYIKGSLEFLGEELLIAEQRENSTYFSGTIDTMAVIGASQDDLVDDDEIEYLYEWTISDWPIETETDENKQNRPVWEGVGYHLKLCNSDESPNGAELYLPLREESYGVVKRLLETMGEVEIAEQREDFTYFEGKFDSMRDIEMLDLLFDLYKVDLTLTNHRY